MAMTGDEILKLKTHLNTNEYNDNENYYSGKNTKILTAPDKRKPDNRVPIAFANRLIKNLTGYAGRAGDIITEWVQMKENDDKTFLEAYKKVEQDSKLNLLNSKLYKTVLKHGIAFDLTWTEQDTDGKLLIKSADLPITQCLPIWEDKLNVNKQLNSFIRYYDLMTDKTMKIGGQETILLAGEYAQVFYPRKYEIWFLKGFDKNAKSDPIMILEQDQPFDKIQVSSYFCNDEEISYWLPVRNLIDEFDKIISKNMNEVDRFNDTWLMFIQKIEPQIKQKIDQMGIIDDLQSAFSEFSNDVFPRFLERNVPVEHTKLMLDSFENLIYTIIGVPSFLDDKFASASGVSLLFKLIGLEYAAVETDTYFDLGLQNRNDLIKQALSTITEYQGITYTQESLKNYKSEIKHKRNIPLDKTTIINEAVQLRAAGLSLEAILNYLPKEIVPNVQEELDRASTQISTQLPDLTQLN